MADSPASAEDRGAVLLAIARQTLEETLGATGSHQAPPAISDPMDEHPWLAEPGATFVTLRRADGELRGCIGSLEAARPLLEDLRHNALAAARRDPRFPRVEADELGALSLEVTVLDPPRPFPIRDEADALARLRPGVDGLVLGWGRHRATFLPQVWESLPEPRDFLAQLKRKAGMATDFWHPDIELRRYTVEKWAEG